MHRSGTSVTSRLLHRAGLDLGTRLMAPSLDNPVGYYEDLDFYDLNEALIDAAVDGGVTLEPAWACVDRLDATRLEPLRERAGTLIAERGARAEPWGFKDPRASLLLDFYIDLEPETRFLFVYREPWDVVRSLICTADHALFGRVDLAVAAWTAYNDRILEFRERNHDRTRLVHVDAIARVPEQVLGLAQGLLDDITPAALNAASAQGAFREELLHRLDPHSALVQLFASAHGDALGIYERLEHAADLPAGGDENVMAASFEAAEPTRSGDSAGTVRVSVGAPRRPDVHPADAASACRAADAAIRSLTAEVVVVDFGRDADPTAVDSAIAMLEAAPGIGAVLLAGGPSDADHDLLDSADAEAVIVLRRSAWLAVRGFAAATPEPGYEAWAFAARCRARGIPVERTAGESIGNAVSRDDGEARLRLLRSDPVLALHVATRAETRARTAQMRAEAAEQRVRDAEEALSWASAELEAIHRTRSWRAVVTWWRWRSRLVGGACSDSGRVLADPTMAP